MFGFAVLVWLDMWKNQLALIFQLLRDSSKSRLKESRASSSLWSRFSVERIMLRSCSEDSSGNPVEIIIARREMRRELCLRKVR